MLAATFDIVEMFPGPGLHGRNLARGGFEAQAVKPVRGLEGHDATRLVVLVGLRVEPVAVQLPELSFGAADAGTGKGVQRGGALDLDAHHAAADDHEIEVRAAAVVAQVPA